MRKTLQKLLIVTTALTFSCNTFSAFAMLKGDDNNSGKGNTNRSVSGKPVDENSENADENSENADEISENTDEIPNTITNSINEIPNTITNSINGIPNDQKNKLVCMFDKFIRKCEKNMSTEEKKKMKKSVEK